ncbi:MAG: hypothetical protein KME07_04880 [Pegethrix bostrychoides GSE-TBD4-15B]|jgi:hypothetical protein|uniref:Uncharacterized protein n=1 Tax=Pegethrix bostrychoides GSE-TBD4-15B TaxID=2839662 RepID=A0A951U3N3_9CYAN|nr:hypothetical protein [Pegethrix bostrychoides GSE-TBD4-15B]
MDGISLDKASDWLLLVAALVTSMVIFSFLFRILRTVIGSIITLAIVAIVVQFVFGITPAELLNDATRFAQSLWQKFGY